MRTLTILFTLLLSFVFASPAYAITCRHRNHHEICIVNIKRSAKNYWEYRASIRVDGVTKPVQIYDCRTRKVVLDNPILEEFEQDDTAQFVCSFFKKPWDAFGVASGKPTTFRNISPSDSSTRLKTP